MCRTRFVARQYGFIFVALVALTTYATAPEPAAAKSVQASKAAGPEVPIDPAARYNEVQQRSIHNAYDKTQSIFSQMTEFGVRSLELDIHVGHWSSPALPNDWYVYHRNSPMLDHSTCFRLSACLEELRRFHDRTPNHQVITLFLDLKDDFVMGGHAPAELDAELLALLPRGTVFTPADRPTCSSGTPCWPRFGDMTGRFVVALTGAGACTQGGPLNEYVAPRIEGISPVGFIAPDVDHTCPYRPASLDAAFFNMDFDEVDFSPTIRSQGLMGRVYAGGLEGGMNKQNEWERAKQAGAQFLVTDIVDAGSTPWLL